MDPLQLIAVLPVDVNPTLVHEGTTLHDVARLLSERELVEVPLTLIDVCRRSGCQVDGYANVLPHFSHLYRFPFELGVVRRAWAPWVEMTEQFHEDVADSTGVMMTLTFRRKD